MSSEADTLIFVQRTDSMSGALDRWRHEIFDNRDSYTVKMGNSSVHIQRRLLLLLLCLILVIAFIYYLLSSGVYGLSLKPKTFNLDETILLRHDDDVINPRFRHHKINLAYPFTKPIEVYKETFKYRIALIADPDTSNRLKDRWYSFLQLGWLTFNAAKASVVWDDERQRLTTNLNSGGRSMELSELVVFDGQLLTIDDRTGVVYRIRDFNVDVSSGKDNQDARVVPWIILADGNGDVSKGFKGEWMTVKNKELYIGSLGKEWTTNDGKVLNHNPQFVKRISADGSVLHEDWSSHYRHLLKSANITSPGYMIHEAVCWSEKKNKWFFLPRRASHQSYNDVADERRGTNLLLKADKDFKSVKVTKLGPKIDTHGFSSFKFIPFTEDQYIVALKSEEDSTAERTATYITVLDVTGRVILPETLIDDKIKYEGIEFV